MNTPSLEKAQKWALTSDEIIEALRELVELAEFGTAKPVDGHALIARLWQPVPENVSMLRASRFGELIRVAGIDTARAYAQLG